MSVQGLLLPLGAALAVAVLIGLVRILAPGKAPRLAGADEAARVADSLPGGFAAQQIMLDAQGHGAIMQDAAGRLALVLPHGAHFLARRATETVTTVGDQPGHVLVRAGPLRTELDLGDKASEWLGRLHGERAAQR